VQALGYFQGVLTPLFDPFIQDLGYEFPRILLLGDSLNRGITLLEGEIIKLLVIAEERRAVVR
jgi:hypothetical protein